MKRNWFRKLSTVLAMLFLFSGNVLADENLQVHFLNVGQADSTLITCGEHAMLIDAGNNDDDVPVLNYIQNKQGITSLDYVICTHPHEDHIGAMDAVIETIGVSEVLMPNVTTTTQTFEDLLTAIDNKGLGITIPEVGQEYTLGDAKFTIIAPASTYGDDLNNWSVGIKLIYGDTSFVFTGDAEEGAEYDILNTGVNLSADVFQVGHHGSSTSNTDALLDAVSPDYAVISCGADNSYGHPNQEALQRLQNHGVEIFRTDIQGSIVATSDGSNIEWSVDATNDWSSGAPSNEGNEDSGKSSISSREVSVEEEPVQEEVSDTGVTVHITNTGSKYHSSGCQYLKKSDIEVSLSEALSRGLEPCSKCNPPS